MLHNNPNTSVAYIKKHLLLIHRSARWLLHLFPGSGCTQVCSIHAILSYRQNEHWLARSYLLVVEGIRQGAKAKRLKSLSEQAVCHVTSYSFGQGKPRSQAKHQLGGNIYLSRDVVERMTICGIITNLPIICFWITNINFPFFHPEIHSPHASEDSFLSTKFNAFMASGLEFKIL